MSTKAGTIGLSAGRPIGFVVWTAVVSTVAAAALIMSALALTRVGDTSGGSAPASVGSAGYTLWDAAKLEAMQGRVLAEAATPAYALWDAGKLEAMGGRVLAANVGSLGYTLWDVGKLQAMAGRVLADSRVSQDYVLWDEAKLEAMAGRTQAEN